MPATKGHTSQVIAAFVAVVFLLVSTSGASFGKHPSKTPGKKASTELQFDWNSTDGDGNSLALGLITPISFLYFAVYPQAIEVALSPDVYLKSVRMLYILFQNFKAYPFK